MGLMNSPTFRNMWRDENFESRAHVVVTALDNDLDGMRAYFCGRAWFPVRIPLFFMGMLLAPCACAGKHGINQQTERKWAKFTDYFSLLCIMAHRVRRRLRHRPRFQEHSHLQ